MQPEFIEGFHYVKEDREPVVREPRPLSERLAERDLWEGIDWHYYDMGFQHADFGFPPRSENPFYCKGYEEGKKKYL